MQTIKIVHVYGLVT